MVGGDHPLSADPGAPYSAATEFIKKKKAANYFYLKRTYGVSPSY